MSIAKQIIKEGLGQGAKFILVELADGEWKPVYDKTGQLLKFTEGGAAQKAAQWRSVDTGNKCQPRPVNDGEWRKREDKRMKGEYTLLPWHSLAWWQNLSSKWKDHYPHVSITKGAFISYTENEEKGAADIQTVIRPGKYLEKFFSEELGQYVIRDLCTVLSAKFEDNLLLFAETAEEIVEVYTNGPSSCMSKGKGDFHTGGVHPCSAYASGDLKIAYLMRDGKISARSVIYPAGKTYNSIYGDSGRLGPLLQKMGLKAGPPVGARLLKIRHSVGDPGKFVFVVPHVDKAPGVRVEGDYLVVCDPGKDVSGAIQWAGGAGVTEPLGYGCAKCKCGELPQRQIFNVFITDRHTAGWCKSCMNTHALPCVISSYWVEKSLMLEMQGVGKMKFMWDKYFKDHGFVCDHDGLRYWNDHKAVLPDGRKVNVKYAKTVAFQCYSCLSWKDTQNQACSKCKQVTGWAPYPTSQGVQRPSR